MDFTNRIIENWQVDAAFTRVYGKNAEYTKKTYHCTCVKCGNKKDIASSDLNRKRNLVCSVCSSKHHSYQNDDLTGTRQGSLTIGKAFRRNGRTYYHVQCDCAKEYDILRDNLIRKKYPHCKCHGSAINPDKKYGFLQPVRRMPDGNWECLCDCGNICYKSPGSMLREDENRTRSCGCKKQANNVAIRSDNRSGVKGVFHDTKRSGKWIAYINKEGKRYNLGRYDTKELAAEAREIAEKELFQRRESML